MDFFNGIINIDKIDKHEQRTGYIPLQKRNDTDNGLKFQIKTLLEAGCEIIDVIDREPSETKIIVIRDFGDEVGPEEATDIFLKLCIIKRKGILVPEPWLHASFNANYTKYKISDITIHKDYVNEGYGTLLLRNLIKLAKEHNIEEISGWISGVDYDHIDRLVHFYKKHNFEVTLYKESTSLKIGDLLWQNDSLSKD